MKYNIIIPVAALMLASQGCMAPEGPEKTTFTASYSENVRTSLQDNNLVYWSPGDRIAVFCDDSGSPHEFSTALTSESPSAEFTGTIPAASRYTAFYPFSGPDGTQPGFDGNNITFSIPALQQGTPGSFTSGLNPSFAATEGTDRTLGFRNLCALVKITLEGDGLQSVRSIALSDNAGNLITGTAGFNITDNILTAEEGNTSVTLTSDAFEQGRPYYFVVLPSEQAMQQGITISFRDAEGSEVLSKSTSSAIALAPGRIINLGTIAVTAESTPDYEIDQDGTYLVYTGKGLMEWGNQVRSGAWRTSVKLMKDITLTQHWTPLGTVSNSYYGTVDGNNKTIRGLVIDHESATGQREALIGCLKGEVRDLNVESPYISGDSYCGVICGENDGGTISNCHITGCRVSADRFYAGGITGYNYTDGLIIGCSVTGTVTGNSESGGIAGATFPINAEISGCSFEGEVSVTTQYAGGIIGKNFDGNIYGCYATGKISAGSNAGGITGLSDKGVYSSFFIGEVSGTASGLAIGNNAGQAKAVYYLQDGGSISVPVGSGKNTGIAEAPEGWEAAIEDMNANLGADRGYIFVMDAAQGHPVLSFTAATAGSRRNTSSR